MIGCVHNIIRNAILDDKPRNILVAPYDGLFELSLCQHTPHNYYLINTIKKFKQPEVFHKQLKTINYDITKRPLDIDLDIDLIICNDIVSQIQLCNQLSNMFHIPMIIVYHSIIPSFVKKEDIHILLQNYKYATRISTHTIINNSWYANFPIITYGIDLIKDIQQENKILVIGTFDKESLIKINIIKQNVKLPITIIGNNPNLSSIETFEQCLSHIKTHKFFINLYNDSDINPLMLLAMGAGCTVISSKSKLNDNIIVNGQNGYLIDSIENILDLLKNYKQLNNQIGNNAQLTIQHNFNNAKFNQEWNKVITQSFHTPFRV